VSRFSGLLHVEASRAKVFQSIIKTGGGVTRMVHMTSSWTLRQDQIEDGRVDMTGCVGLCYHYFAVFIVLGHMRI
jgi:hypothetical protein